MALKYVQVNTLYLAGAGNIIGATSLVLTSLTDIYGNVLTMTDFGTKGYGTCEADTTNEEAFTFTGVTANANGTYTFTGVSTALAKSPYTETSGLIRQHSGGTKLVITDNVAFWNTFANVNNLNTFAILPQSAVTPTANADLATKVYVDGVAIAGAPNASDVVKGITKLSIAPVSGTNPIAVGDNDTRVPTVAQTSALAGTSGTAPSGSNKFVDAADRTGISLPSGSILPFAVASAPTGFLLCDGTAVSRTTYATLFGILSTTYGVGNGTTTFNVPDLRGRVPVGLNAGTFNAIAGTGGEETHLLTAAESGVPAHTHQQQVFSTGSAAASVALSGSGQNLTATSANAPSTLANSTASAASAHNNLQPYLTIQYIIKT